MDQDGYASSPRGDVQAEEFYESRSLPGEWHPETIKTIPEMPGLSAFPALCLLLKLLGGEIYLAVSQYTFVRFVLHIHLISHFCVPRLNFLEPKWSHFLTHNCIYRN